MPHGEKSLRRRRPAYRAILAAAATVAGLALPGATSGATAAKTVPFTGSFSGRATLLIDNGNVSISAIRGSGSASLVGRSAVSGKGAAAATAQCDPFSGTGSIVGAAGAIRFVVARSTSTEGCSTGETGPVTINFQGIARAVGGTGKAKGASGSLKFSGTLQLSNTTGTESGPFTAKLSGRLQL